MPFPGDGFEDREKSLELKPKTIVNQILGFLESHRDQAFTQSEIRTKTAMSEGSVGPTLVRLRKAGLVDHKEPYWRLSDHAKSLAAAVTHGNEVAREQEMISFDREEWETVAEDPRNT